LGKLVLRRERRHAWRFAPLVCFGLRPLKPSTKSDQRPQRIADRLRLPALPWIWASAD
jgi:hypothetical protein